MSTVLRTQETTEPQQWVGYDLTTITLPGNSRKSKTVPRQYSVDFYQVRFYSGSALSVSKRTHTSPNFNNEINTNHEHLHVWPWQPCNHKMKLTMWTQRRACSTGALMWGGKALRVHWLVPPAYTCVEWVCASYSSQTGHSPSFLINHCPEWGVHLWHVSILTNAVTFLTVFWCFVLSSSITLVLWTTATCSCTQFIWNLLDLKLLDFSKWDATNNNYSGKVRRILRVARAGVEGGLGAVRGYVRLGTYSFCFKHLVSVVL